MSDCIQRLMSIFSEKFSVRVESSDADLLNTGILDSMTFVELLLNIEQEFGIRMEIEDLDLENFWSIASIAEMLKASQARALAPLATGKPLRDSGLH